MTNPRQPYSREEEKALEWFKDDGLNAQGSYRHGHILARLVRIQEEEIARLKKQAEGLCDGCGKELDDAFCVRCLSRLRKIEAIAKKLPKHLKAVRGAPCMPSYCGDILHDLICLRIALREAK